MHETFRLRRRYLYLGLIFAAIVAVPTVACLCGLALPDRPIEHPRLVSVAMALPWFGFCGLGLYLALAYLRRRLRVNGPSVTIEGVWRTKSLDLTQITMARWFPGCVKLYAAAGRTTIWIADYETEARERLVAHLHHQIAPQLQRDWLMFERRQLRFREVGPDQVELNRRRIDRWLLPGISVGFLTTFAVWWGTGDVRNLTVGIGCVALIGALRYAFPKRGYPATTIRGMVRAQPEFKWFLWWSLGGWLLAGIACILKGTLGPMRGASLVFGIVWIVGVLAIAFRIDRREARLRRELEAEWQASCTETSREPTAKTCSPAKHSGER